MNQVPRSGPDRSSWEWWSDAAESASLIELLSQMISVYHLSFHVDAQS